MLVAALGRADPVLHVGFDGRGAEGCSLEPRFGNEAGDVVVGDEHVGGGLDGGFLGHFDEAPFAAVHPGHFGGPEAGASCVLLPLRALGGAEFSDEVLSVGAVSSFVPSLSVEDTTPLSNHDVHGSVVHDAADEGGDFIEFGTDGADDFLWRLGLVEIREGIVFVRVDYDGTGMSVDLVSARSPRHGISEVPSIADVQRDVVVDGRETEQDFFVPIVHVRSVVDGFVTALDTDAARNVSLSDFIGDELETAYGGVEVPFLVPQVGLTTRGS